MQYFGHPTAVMCNMLYASRPSFTAHPSDVDAQQIPAAMPYVLVEQEVWVLQISQLMGHYTQHTGQQFSGGNSQYAKLAQIASEKCGINIPPALLMKL